MRHKLRTFVGVLVVATVAALFFRFIILEDYRISSDSMYPTLLSGDLVFVSKSAFNIRLPFSSYQVASVRSPRRSEVVAFTLPERGLDTFVKRVVAIEGDRVSIQDGVLFINDVAAVYQPLKAGETQSMEKTEWGNYPVHFDKLKLKNYGPVDVPKNHFFALGDNREDSVDSRTWGPVPYSCLKGRVALVWLSLNPQGTFLRDRVGLWVQ